MAEITPKRRGELMQGLFKNLVSHSEGLPAKEALAALATAVPPTPFESAEYPSSPGVRRYEFIVRFTTIPFVKAGWLIKEKGQWSVSDTGRAAFQQFTDPEKFAQEARRLYRQWTKQHPKQEEEEVEEEDTESKVAVVSLEEAEEKAWLDIQKHLVTMNPFDFQELVAGLLRGMDYHVAWVSPPGPDGGLDIIAHSDPLGITGPRIKVQVKRKATERISVEGVRSFMALLADGDVGLFVATAGFSKEAQAEARRQEKRRIMLIDLKVLFDLWVEHYEKIPEIQRRHLTLRPIYFLDEEE